MIDIIVSFAIIPFHHSMYMEKDECFNNPFSINELSASVYIGIDPMPGISVNLMSKFN